MKRTRKERSALGLFDFAKKLSEVLVIGIRVSKQEKHETFNSLD